MEDRLKDKMQDVIQLVQSQLEAEPLIAPESDPHGAAPQDTAEEARYDEDGWGDEGPSAYLQEEGYEDAEGDGFDAELEIDEIPE